MLNIGELIVLDTIEIILIEKNTSFVHLLQFFNDI